MHRTDGPAEMDSSGNWSWYRRGRRHRSDGPARRFASGKEVWYWEGKLIAWALPGSLFRMRAAREALEGIADPEAQRAAAMTVLPTLQRAAARRVVADALASDDESLRLWGLRASAVLPDQAAPRAPSPRRVPGGR